MYNLINIFFMKQRVVLYAVGWQHIHGVYLFTGDDVIFSPEHLSTLLCFRSILYLYGISFEPPNQAKNVTRSLTDNHYYSSRANVSDYTLSVMTCQEV
jgi:hypothetical protein